MFVCMFVRIFLKEHLEQLVKSEDKKAALLLAKSLAMSGRKEHQSREINPKKRWGAVQNI